MSGSFKVTIDQLKNLMEQSFNSKSEAEVKKNVDPVFNGDLGGLTDQCSRSAVVSQGLATRLNCELASGIKSDSAGERTTVYGMNKVEQEPPESIPALMFEAAKDPTMLILLAAAVVSLVCGVVPGLAIDPAVDWIEGAAIMITCFVVCLVAALNDWQKDRQFRKLNDVKDDGIINVIRDGAPTQTSVYKIVVGDIIELTVGDILCGDGIIVQSHNMKINESSLTGESDDLSKGRDYVFLDGKVSTNPFVYSGTQVMEGTGSMLVTCVGSASISGNISKVLTDTEKDDTVLQEKLNDMAALVAKMGLAIAVLTLVVLYIRFTVSFFTGCDPEQTVESQENYCASGPGQGAGKKQSFKSPHRSELIHGFVTSITLLVVAIPEGLPLAVTITMAYSVQKMLADMNLVRYLGACETMGSATTICSDKTGTLTTNRMTVMKSWMGGTLYDTMPDASAVKKKLLQTVFNSIGLNSTGRLDATNPKPGMPVMHIGNKTECAMLAFVNALGGDYEAVRSALTAEQNTEKEIHTFSSARKRMSTLVPNEKGGFRLYCKGAAEIVLELCTSMLNGEGEPMPFSQQDRDNARNKVIKYFAEDGLRCIALAIRDFDKKPELVNDWLDLEKNLSLVLLVGIEDPVRDEVPIAIELCRKAGIMVRMVTGDNIETARSIARKCGILPPTGQAHQYEVMEGPTFRQMCVEANGDVKQDEIDKVWPHLRVLARSSPTDKYSLVTGIKKSTIGDLQIVAVTGDGTNDGPALKQADVGFAMGITGTAIAQEASDIILMDDNFNSIVKAVKWGRNVYDNVGKFLQFQLTVNVVAVVVCFITSAVTASSILSTVQMLWVNLIMDSLAALALATEMPTDNLLDRKPYPRNRALLSRLQLRFIFGHAALQLAVIFILVYYLEPHQCEEPDQWIGTNGLFYTHDCIEPTHEHGQKAMPTELWHSHCPQRAGFNHSDPEDKPLACPWHKNKVWVTPQAKRDKCYEMCMNPHDNLEESGHGDAQDDIRFKTLVFNTFVMMQAANEINARKLNGELNVFDKLLSNKIFVYVVIGTILLQVLMVQVFAMSEKFGEALKPISRRWQVRPISWQYWLISIGCAFFEFPFQLLLHYCYPKFLLVEPITASEDAGHVSVASNKVTPAE